MPNRLIKESICTSEDLDCLSPMAEILFYRLIVNADDYGCFHGNESIVKSKCFPLKSDDIKCDQMKSWLDELDTVGLITRYIGTDGRRYIKLTKWEKHQQVRAKKRKFPEPETVCEHPISNDINSEQMKSDDSKCPRNPIQSNPESNPYPNTNDANTRKQIQTPMKDSFDEFWDTYPKKTGDIRLTYQEYLFAIEETKPEVLLEALKKQVEAADEDDLKYFHSADKWLRNREWKKPVTASKKKNARRPFEPTQFDDQGGLK